MIGKFSTHDNRLVLAALPTLVYWVLSALYAGVGHFVRRQEMSSTTDGDDNKNKNRAYPLFVAMSVLSQQCLHCVFGFLLLDASASRNTMTRGFGRSAVSFLSAMILLDAYQYHFHALMHSNGWLYRNIHATHHRIVSPYAFAALYVHPIESILLDGASGMFACGASGLAAQPILCSIFLCLSTAKTVSDHSGLELCGHPLYDPLMLFFRNNSQYHAFHHSLGRGRGKMHLSQPYLTVWDQWYNSRRG